LLPFTDIFDGIWLVEFLLIFFGLDFMTAFIWEIVLQFAKQ